VHRPGVGLKFVARKTTFEIHFGRRIGALSALPRMGSSCHTWLATQLQATAFGFLQGCINKEETNALSHPTARVLLLHPKCEILCIGIAMLDTKHHYVRIQQKARKGKKGEDGFRGMALLDPRVNGVMYNRLKRCRFANPRFQPTALHYTRFLQL
jgi:hypothetical protein